ATFREDQCVCGSQINRQIARKRVEQVSHPHLLVRYALSPATPGTRCVFLHYRILEMPLKTPPAERCSSFVVSPRTLPRPQARSISPIQSRVPENSPPQNSPSDRCRHPLTPKTGEPQSRFGLFRPSEARARTASRATSTRTRRHHSGQQNRTLAPKPGSPPRLRSASRSRTVSVRIVHQLEPIQVH